MTDDEILRSEVVLTTIENRTWLAFRSAVASEDAGEIETLDAMLESIHLAKQQLRVCSRAERRKLSRLRSARRLNALAAVKGKA